MWAKQPDEVEIGFHLDDNDIRMTLGNEALRISRLDGFSD